MQFFAFYSRYYFLFSVNFTNYGEIRLYILASFFLGFAIERISIGTMLAKVFNFLYNIFSRLIKKIKLPKILSKKEGKNLMRESTLKLLVKILTAFAVIVFVVLIALLGFQYVSINNLESQQESLANELNSLIETRENYETEYDYIQNYYNDYIEDYVREVLGWGREGEIQFHS